MVLPFSDNQDPRSWASRMRRARMALFTRLLQPFPEPVRVLDVGGTLGSWRTIRPQIGKRVHLTILNLSHSPERIAGVDLMVGDARCMSEVESASFDVCFSNSVIEHVGTLADQCAMANEISRVGRCYFIQTPYKYFPLEAHYHVPGWQFLPLSLRAQLHQRFDLGWIPKQPDPERARAEVASIRLLSMRDMHRLFPDAELKLERVGPLVKSLIAVRQAGDDTK